MTMMNVLRRSLVVAGVVALVAGCGDRDGVPAPDTTPPTVSGVSASNADGPYGIGDTINVTVTFSESVTVTGNPTLDLNSGAAAVATYASGTGTVTLVFDYTVAAAENSGDLDYDATTSLALAGGTIQDAAANDATLTLAAPGAAGSLGANKAIVIDGDVPTVSSVVLTGSPTETDASVTYEVTFSEEMTGFTEADLTLTETGTATGTVNAPSTLDDTVFTVVVDTITGEGTLRLDVLDDGTVDDLAGNNLAAAYSSGDVHTADRVAPTVTSVSSTSLDGAYRETDTVDVTVTFSEAVTVTGTPTLTLNSGAAAVDYSSGSPGTVLTFTYTVGAGDTSADLDYAATTSLSDGGGTIRDAAGNDATLTLPTVGGASSLGGQKDIVIDTTAPTVASVSSTNADGTYSIGATVDVTVTFSEAVTVTGTPTLTLNSGAAAVDYSSGSPGTVLTFTYTVGAGDTSADLDYVATTSLVDGGGTIQDAAGNDATLTLPTVGGASSLGGQKDIVIDTTGPSVVNVTSAIADGAYKAGTVIDIDVTFTGLVTYDLVGTLTLDLNTGVAASYNAGTGTDTLTFRYTVAGGETVADLDYVATNSLVVAGGGTVRDAASQDADLTLAAPAAAGSLGGNKAIEIDTTAPQVTNVTSTKGNGTYTVPELINITVDFDEIVTVSGVPTLTLDTGGAGTTVNYNSGSGSNTLVFAYTVGASQDSADLDYVDTASLSDGGGSIQDAATNDATLTLAAPGAAGSLGDNKAIVIDTTAPTVTGVTAAKADGFYNVGEVIDVEVAFSETVYVTGTPWIMLNSGAPAVTLFSGDGTNTLTFRYTVGVTETSADLDYAATDSLSFGGGAIRDLATNLANITLPAPGAAGSISDDQTIVIDTTAPTVTSVTSPDADAIYGIGATITVDVTFSEVITVAGGPTFDIALNSGTAAVASYSGGSGSATLSFDYTVAADDLSIDLGYDATSSLTIAGGTARDSAGNDAVLTLPAVGGGSSLSGQKAIVVDGVAPTITFVTSLDSDGTYGIGSVLDVSVVFSENVDVTGVPTIDLNSGAATVATYAAGTGSDTLAFDYTVAVGESSADLNYDATTSLSVAGATIRDAAGNDADVTLPPLATVNSLGGNKAIVIDTSAPSVSNVSSTNLDGAYRAGASIDVTVTFTAPVTVAGGVPYIDLSNGAAAWYSSGSGSATLTFTYNVGPAEDVADLGYALTTSLNANGATIQDVATQNASLTLPAPGGAGSLSFNKAIEIDTVQPTVTNVTSPELDGTYPVDSSIDIEITFDEAVTVDTGGGTPQLWLNSGPTPAYYSSGSGTATLTFTYVVAQNDNSADLDYQNAGALNTAGGTIRDAATNDANVTLPYPGPGLLAINKNIVIEAQQPWVNWSQPGDTSTNVGLAEEIIVQFNETMDPATFATGVHVYWGGTNEPLNGYDMTWNGGTNELTIIPDTQDPAGVSNNDLLLADTAYTITVDITVTDVNGNPIDQDGGTAGSQPYNATFTTRETTPPELISMEVEDDGAATYDAMYEVVPVDCLDPGDTIDFLFVDSVTLNPDTMNQARVRIEIRGSDDQEIQVQIEDRGTVRSVTEVGGGVYTYETWDDHNLGGGQTVDVVMMTPAGYNVTDGVITWISPTEFQVTADGGSGLGNLTDDSYGNVTVVSDWSGMDCDLSWTAADQLTLTLGPDVSFTVGGEYSVRLNEVSDLAWNNLEEEEYVLQVMSDEVSGDGPIVLSTIPADGVTYDRAGPIIISFSETIDANSIAGITITGTGVDTSDFEIDYEPGEDMGMAMLFIGPIQALPESTFVTVTLPGTGAATAIADLAGNEMAADYIFGYWTDVETDGFGPTINMTLPADGETNAGTWDQRIQISFMDSDTGDPEVIDETSIDMGDFRIVEDPLGTPITHRGWRFDLWGEGTILSLWPSSWPGLEEGKTYRVYVGPGINDMAGNAMAGEEWFQFTVATGAQNHTPVLRNLEIEMAGSTTPTARALSIDLEIRDEDDDVVTVTIDDSFYGGSVTIVSDRITHPDNWDWWPGEGEFEYGDDGPPMGGEPPELDTDDFYDASGYYWFDITLDDGTNSSTYTVSTWIWATDADADKLAVPHVVPSLVSVGGVAVSAAEPALIADSTPTLVWQDVDTANADVAALYLIETSALGDNEGAGYQFAVGLNPNDASLTIPDDRPLEPSVYLWALMEMKFAEGFGETIGQGWSLDFAQVMLGDMSPFFVYGPTNSNLWDDEHAVGRIGVTLDSETGAYTGCNGFSGTYVFGQDLATNPVDSAVAIVGVDAGGGAAVAQEFYAYEAPNLTITDSSAGMPMPVKGFTGRSEGMFSVTRGADPSSAAITVGSERAAGPFSALTDFDGQTWSCAGCQIDEDGAGGFDSAGAFYGSFTIAATDASSGVVMVSVTNQNGASGPAFPVPFTLDTVTGEFVIDMGAGDTARGYVGGGVNKDVIVLSRNTNADYPWMLVAARQQVVTGVAQITGDYNFTQIMLQQDDSSGHPYDLQYVGTMSGTVTFHGDGNWDAAVVMSDGQTDSASGTYVVSPEQGITMVDGSGVDTEMMVGPDFNTGFGIAVDWVGGTGNHVRLIIATKP